MAEQAQQASAQQRDSTGSTPVGFLVDGDMIVCQSHTTIGYSRVPIYHDNIYPYKQSCGICGKLLVAGQTEAWPELFNRKGA